MPELELRRKGRRVAWWWLLLAVLVVALGIWWAVDYAGEDEVDSSQAAGEQEDLTVVPPDEPEVLPISFILTQTEDYVGRQVTGVATVVKLVSDRGFWVEQAGSRILVVLREENPSARMLDVQAGQRVELQGQVIRAEDAGRVPGGLEAALSQAVRSQRAFIFAAEDDLQVIPARPDQERD